MKKIIVKAEQFRTALEKFSACLIQTSDGLKYISGDNQLEICYHLPYKGTVAPGKTLEPINYDTQTPQ